MVEIIVLVFGFIMAILIAMTRSAYLQTSSLSDFELERRREAGDKSAARELGWRSLTPTFEAAKNIKVIILLVSIANKSQLFESLHLITN